VIHDGSAFELAVDLRRYGFDVAEGPVSVASGAHEEAAGLAVIAARPGGARGGRLRELTRQLCGTGATVLAVGAAIGPVAELFGSAPTRPSQQPASSRLVDVGSTGEGLFAELPAVFRLALPSGDRFLAAELSSEFGATAWSKDGELIGASHVFRPVHLLHAGALESTEIRAVVLRNLLRLLRERGGRAF
jgi:hypothetical protein